jgi:hypothetical protein
MPGAVHAPLLVRRHSDPGRFLVEEDGASVAEVYAGPKAPVTGIRCRDVELDTKAERDIRGRTTEHGVSPVAAA